MRRSQYLPSSFVWPRSVAPADKMMRRKISSDLKFRRENDGPHMVFLAAFPDPANSGNVVDSVMFNYVADGFEDALQRASTPPKSLVRWLQLSLS